MNLYGLYQLGSLAESWYGSGQLLGDLPGDRRWRQHRLRALRHGGDGPSDALGRGDRRSFLGLWPQCGDGVARSRSRIGDHLRGQMVGILVFTAILGQLHPMIDNSGPCRWGLGGGDRRLPPPHLDQDSGATRGLVGRPGREWGHAALRWRLNGGIAGSRRPTGRGSWRKRSGCASPNN